MFDFHRPQTNPRNASVRLLCMTFLCIQPVSLSKGLLKALVAEIEALRDPDSEIVSNLVD
jgi:hypothetical protein